MNYIDFLPSLLVAWFSVFIVIFVYIKISNKIDDIKLKIYNKLDSQELVIKSHINNIETAHKL